MIPHPYGAPADGLGKKRSTASHWLGLIGTGSRSTHQPTDPMVAGGADAVGVDAA